MSSFDLAAAGLLTARPFDGPGWSVEWQKSAGCSLQLKRRRWHVLSFYPEAEVRIARRSQVKSECFQAECGSLGLYPARTAEEVEWLERRVSALHIHIAPERLAAISSALPGVRRMPSFHDPHVARLTGGLYELMRATRQETHAAIDIMDQLISVLAERYTTFELPNDQLIGRVGLNSLLDHMYGSAAVEADIEGLVALAGVSRGYFFRAFKSLMGTTPHALLARSRLELAKEQIRTGERLADIAQECGFSDQSHFANTFRHQIGLSAGAFANWFDA